MKEATRKEVYVVTDSWGDFEFEYSDFYGAFAMYEKLAKEYDGKRDIFLHKVNIRPMFIHNNIKD